MYLIFVNLLLRKDQNSHLSERVVNMNLRLIHDVLPGLKQVFHLFIFLFLEVNVGRLFLYFQSYNVSEVLHHILCFLFFSAKIQSKSTLQNGIGALTLALVG